MGAGFHPWDIGKLLEHFRKVAQSKVESESHGGFQGCVEAGAAEEPTTEKKRWRLQPGWTHHWGRWLGWGCLKVWQAASVKRLRRRQTNASR